MREAIFEITDACAHCLGTLEGNTYRRFSVTVFDQDDQPVTAFTYINTGQLEDGQPSGEHLAMDSAGFAGPAVVLAGLASNPHPWHEESPRRTYSSPLVFLWYEAMSRHLEHGMPQTP